MAINKKSTRPNGKAKKSKGSLRVDFTDTDVRVLVPEGDYHLKVEDVTMEESDGGNDYLKWVFSIMDDDKRVNDQKIYYNTSLLKQALWNLRNLLETLGVETPDGPLDLELDEYKGLECMGSIEHETYEGKKRAKVTSFEPLTDTAESEDDTEEEAEDEESEEADGEEEEEETEESEDESAESEEEDEDKLTADEVKAMKHEELKDLVKKHKLEIKKPSPLPKKYRAQVMDALEAAELLAS